MISHDLDSVRYGGSLSVQLCFPGIRSATNSSSKSFGEDDASTCVECSDDEVSLKDAFRQSSPYNGVNTSAATFNTTNGLGNTLPRQSSCPDEISFNVCSSHPQLPQGISSSVHFPEVEGRDSDTVLNSSFWPQYTSRDHKPRSAAELTIKAVDDRASFPHLGVSYAEAIFGENFFTLYVPLHLAALKGDWGTAKEFLVLKPHAVSARITSNLDTALHVAAGARQTKFVEELVKLMTPDDLALQNKVGNTALCFAAASGVTKIAELMVSKNKMLPSIRGSKGATPLCMAALLGHKDMVWYLYSVTQKEDLTEYDRIQLLVAAISAELYGTPSLNGLVCSASRYLGFRTILDIKAKHIQALELVKQLWERVLLLDDSKIGDFLRFPFRLIFTAVEIGNVDFLLVLIRMYPNLIWKVDEQNRSIFHVAVAHRQERIFSLIHEIGSHRDLISAYKDERNNNILHLAGKLAPPNRLKNDCGAALQLRREVHWFKEVEKIVQPSYREMKNLEGKTPHILFTEEHKRLVREGEKWMKDSASSCMVVATLIATVMFAAAFTVPGGNNNETGRPIFLHRRSFIVFSISNALALFSSATSILMFLSILTSRYAEEDFLHSLPKRLIIGFTTLFVSIATMMSAFSATLFIVLGREFAWIAISVAMVACIPVTLFALLQFPLLADMISHIYSSNIFFFPCNRLLY
ncbi:ankyrin repeat-containing protein NPR4-like isoform X2 [Tripterygium wilfordii]|uniref:ankyrin repeat-containing protein NPR4-like isoform X2 n=1 Tax=Tripterygium wilfordii TaxID=458696 RepID=UPI0018F7F625|nr:ankyrin repeat-containing protein NPR4-like isoform X2 [Tripterygium wilfordii]